MPFFARLCLILALSANSLLSPLTAQKIRFTPSSARLRLDTLAQNPSYWETKVQPLLAQANITQQRFTPDSLDALQIACAKGKVQAIKQLCQKGLSPLRSDRWGRFSLAIAVHYNRTEAVGYLVEQYPALLQHQSEGGYTALFISPQTDTALIRLLIEKGVDINNAGGYSPMVLGAARLPQLKLLLANGGQVQVRDYKGRCPLHYAAAHASSVASLEQLLNAGSPLRALDDLGNSALHWAAFNTHLPISQWLIGQKLAAKLENRNGNTPLHLAARFNANPDVLEALLLAGASANAAADYGIRPIHLAARYSPNKAATIPILLEYGADIEAKNNFGHSVLDYAVEGFASPKTRANDSLGLLTLLKKGADLRAKDAQGRQILHRAAARGQLTAVRVLVEQGAPLELRSTPTASTPILHAIQNKNLAVLKYLFSQGAELRVRSDRGRTIMHHAVFYGFRKELILFLLEQGIDINASDNFEHTPFLEAAEGNDSVELLYFLAAQGAQVQAKRYDQRNALHLLADNTAKDPIPLAKALIDLGVHLHAEDRAGYTPFLTAALNSASVELLYFLAQHGAQVQARSYEQQNALHLLASNRASDLIPLAKALIDLGVNPQAKDKHGRSPADNASLKGKTALAAFLQEVQKR